MSNSVESKPKLLIFSAPSGAGKSTLAKMFLDRHPDKFRLSISCTTRSPRGTEKEGIHYYFVEPHRFQEMMTQGAFLEYAHVFNRYYYGTSAQKVKSYLDQGFHVLFDIDVQGAQSIKKVYGTQCFTVFIMPPSLEELEKRLRGRGTESEGSIKMRMDTARKEIAAAPTFDLQIVNHSLEESYLEIQKWLTQKGFF